MQNLPFSISTLTEKSTNYTYLIPKYFPNIPHDSSRYQYQVLLALNMKSLRVNNDDLEHAESNLDKLETIDC